MTIPLKDRTEGGRLRAGKLTAYANRPDVMVLALPRGGVPVAFEIARALHAPLDVFLVRKLGVPGHEELAMDLHAVRRGVNHLLRDHQRVGRKIGGNGFGGKIFDRSIELDGGARGLLAIGADEGNGVREQGRRPFETPGGAVAVWVSVENPAVKAGSSSRTSLIICRAPCRTMQVYRGQTVLHSVLFCAMRARR